MALCYVRFYRIKLVQLLEHFEEDGWGTKISWLFFPHLLNWLSTELWIEVPGLVVKWSK